MKGTQVVITLFIVLINLCTQAQVRNHFVIRGTLHDSVSGKPINEALIIIRDSTTNKPTYTYKDGAFTAMVKSENITITISQFGYQTKQLHFFLSDSVTNLGFIKLQSLSINLNEVTIKGQSIIAKIVEDTTEFSSSTFEINQNVLLRELVKRLPGIEVSSDGSIYYNGEKIEKIFIDGQEYFGSNILMALKYLSADLIDKLQIITTDNLTAGTSLKNGIEKVKILNLTVKESQKEKLSGNAQLGYGTGKNHIVNLALNKFGHKNQISFFGNMDNINGLQDGIMKSQSGINKVLEVGSNLNFIINANNSFSGNIIFSKLSNRNHNIIRREFTNMLPPGLTMQNNNTTLESNTLNIEIKHQLKIDSLQQLTQRVSFRNNTNLTSNLVSYSNFFPKDSLDINGNGSNFINSKNSSYTYITEYTHNFRNLKGTFSQTIHAAQGHENEITDYSAQYESNSVDSLKKTNLDNYNPIKRRSNIVSAISILTYKAAQHITLNFFYSSMYIQSVENNQVFDQDPMIQGKLTLVDTLSNSWKYVQRQNVMALGIATKSEKFESSLKVNWLLRNQEILPTNSIHALINWNFVHPRLDLIYYFLRTKLLGFTLNFEPSTITPTQLITTRNFQNPLVIQSGNPELKNPIKCNITLRFSSLNSKSLSNFSSTVTYTGTNKKIITNTLFDTLGRQILMPVNMDHSTMLSWGTSWSKPFFRRRFIINLRNNLLYSNDPVAVSGILGTSGSLSITPRVAINYTKKDLIDIQSSFAANRTYSTYNLGAVTKNEVTSLTMNLDVTGYLPLGFIAGVKYNKVINSGLAAGFNRSVDLLNVFVSKRLLKNKMEIKAQGFDLLNKNNSFTRTFTPTYFEDTQSTVLQRFFMGSIIYYIK